MLDVDYGVIGEGEITDVELINTLIEKGDVSNIKGIVYKDDNGEYVKTSNRDEINDLDSIPFPCYEGFEMDKYLSSQKIGNTHISNFCFRQRIFPMILGRSCPFNCKFCFHPVGSKYRTRSLDNFFMELDEVVDKYHPTTISIL